MLLLLLLLLSAVSEDCKRVWSAVQADPWA
jgi:hypothetical protein